MYVYVYGYRKQDKSCVCGLALGLFESATDGFFLLRLFSTGTHRGGRMLKQSDTSASRSMCSLYGYGKPHIYGTGLWPRTALVGTTMYMFMLRLFATFALSGAADFKDRSS